MPRTETYRELDFGSIHGKKFVVIDDGSLSVTLALKNLDFHAGRHGTGDLETIMEMTGDEADLLAHALLDAAKSVST
jgi:hypothetical protein